MAWKIKFEAGGLVSVRCDWTNNVTTDYALSASLLRFADGLVSSSG